MISVEDINEAYSNTPTNITEAALLLGCSRKTLLRIMKEKGVPSKSHSWRSHSSSSVSKKELVGVEIITQEYLQTPRNITDAAKSIGCSVAFLRRSMQTHGISAKHKAWNTARSTEFPALQSAAWLRSELETKSYSLVAKEVGTTAGNVAYYALKHGLSMPGRRSEATRKGFDKKYGGVRGGQNAANWKGGRRTTTKGYIMLWSPEHPLKNGDNYVMEHRLVMEKHLGRYLTPSEVVHHKNGDKQDNRLENLELVSDRGTHTRDHFERSHVTDLFKIENDRLRSLLLAQGINPDILK